MSLIAQKLISASGATEETDDDFNLVTGLYHFDGSNGAQNNTFTGIGPSGASQAWTRNNTPSQGTFSPFSAEEGKWSVEFPMGQATDELEFWAGTTGDFALGTGAFTIECWAFVTADAYTYSRAWQIGPYFSNNSSVGLILDDTDNSSKISFFAYAATGSGRTCISTNATPRNEWFHVAVTRDGTGDFRLFVNGNLDSTNTSYRTTDISPTGDPALAIGNGGNRAVEEPFEGYISNFRLVKGTAVYTSSFTVPTEPLTDITNTKLLTCCSNRFRDKSGASPTLAAVEGTPKIKPFSPFAPSAEYDASTMGGSGSFTRSNQDYINATSSNHAIGTSDFTIECWCYLTDGANSGGNGLFTQPSGYGGPALGQWNNTGWQIYHANTETNISNSGFKQYEWVHVAYVRASNVVNVYQNGVKITSDISDSTNFTNTSFHIGYYYASAYAWDGYISNFKMSLNAIYTSAFTPPTALVTPTSGGSSAASTKILVDFTNGAIIDSSRKTNALTVGNAQLDTSVKKFDTASLELDGTGDYLPLSQSSFIPLGSSDFTIECFAYFTTVASSGLFQLSNGTLNSAVRGPAAGCSSGTGKWGIYHGTTWLEHGSSVPSATTWYHVAFVRNSGTSKFYVDGTEILSATDTTNYTDTYFTIGGWYTTGYLMHGYIDEFRISLKARYTSNFTAPTKAFPNL